MIPLFLRNRGGVLSLAAVIAGLSGAVQGNGLDSAALLDAAGANHWKERRLASRGSDYVFLEEDGTRFLAAASEGGASALYRALELPARAELSLSWRWRVEEPLGHGRSERTREGDDYAARIVVMFDGKPFGRRTRALMYVWAETEPAGASYASPYTANAWTVVVRDEASSPGRWFHESRNVVDDFESAFGETPERVTAVAIMVDTDNTGSRAVTWFDALRFHSARRWM